MIKRQLFELKFSAKLDAVEVQNRVVDAFNKTVVPLMNAYFNEYSLPENSDEIEQLELNLGRIRLSDLEEDLVEKIALSLNEQLPQFCNELVYDDPAVLEAQLAFLAHQSTTDLSTDVTHSSLLDHIRAMRPLADKTRVESETEVGLSLKNELNSPESTQLNEPTKKEASAGLEELQNTSTSETISTKNKRETAEDSSKVNPVLPDDRENRTEQHTRLPINKQLDLISHFLQTGSFPWWENSTTLHRIEMVLESLLQFNPTSLKRLVLDLLGQPIVRKRMVATFKFSHLHQIVELLIQRVNRPKEKSWLLLKEWSKQLGNESDFHEQFWNELFQCVLAELQGLVFLPKTLIHLVNQMGIQQATDFQSTKESSRSINIRFNFIEAIADVFNRMDWKEELETYKEQPTHSSELQPELASSLEAILQQLRLNEETPIQSSKEQLELLSNLEAILEQLHLHEETPIHTLEVQTELVSNLEEVLHQVRLNEETPKQSSEEQTELVSDLETILQQLRLNEVTPIQSSEEQTELVSDLEEVLQQLRLNEEMPIDSSEEQTELLSNLEEVLQQLRLNEETPIHSSEIQTELVSDLETILQQLRLNEETPIDSSEEQLELVSNLEEVLQQLRLNEEMPKQSSELQPELASSLEAILQQLRLNEETPIQSSEEQLELVSNLEAILQQLRLNEETPIQSSEEQLELVSNLETILQQLRLNEETPIHSSEIQTELVSNLEEVLEQLRLNEETPIHSYEEQTELVSNLEMILQQLRLNEETPIQSTEEQTQLVSNLEEVLEQLRLNEETPIHSSEEQTELVSNVETILQQLRLNEETPKQSSELQPELASSLEAILQQLRLNEKTPIDSSEEQTELVSNLETILQQLRLNEATPIQSSDEQTELLSNLEEVLHQLRLKESAVIRRKQGNENPNSLDQNSKSIPSGERLAKLLEQFEAKFLSESTQTNPMKQQVENTKPAAFSPKIDAFSQSDKLYVRNAGLVLLWPFLRPFFEKLELVSEGAFSNSQAAEKASWLLQHLVLGKRAALFEAHLPLNKVLVGMLPDAFVPAAKPITEFEEFAIDELLEAVTNYMPAWKNLTADGFQRAYLQREGALSARDGNWLLQVKRETYDILLDKMPWSISIVKLPWMEHHLIVEW